MNLQNKDYFHTSFDSLFDGIITDIPYKHSIDHVLNEECFDLQHFMVKTDNDTQENAFLITFCNLMCLKDLMNLSVQTHWKFHTYQIWNKEPCRTWLSWTMPLRIVEFIAYFKKGEFKFCFKNGQVNKKVSRTFNSFAGKSTYDVPNPHKERYGMYSEIITFPRVKPLLKQNPLVHPTQKPVEFSKMFSNIVGQEKYVLDPCCGSGNLLTSFPHSIGLDIKQYWN